MQFKENIFGYHYDVLNCELSGLIDSFGFFIVLNIMLD